MVEREAQRNRSRGVLGVTGILVLVTLLLGVGGQAHPAQPSPSSFLAARATERASRRAAVLYVDQLIGSGSCSDYDPQARSCGGGTATAYPDLAGAAAQAQPGDSVLIRQGTYNEQLVPASSGTAGSRITYRGYESETVTISGSFSPAAIILDGVSYLSIEGLTLTGCRWLEATDAHHNIIRDSKFQETPASGTTGNLRFISSDYNQIIGNLIDDGNDNLLLIDSDHNLVQGNTITEGRHSVLSIRCASYNIIRDNYFANSQQKIAEVYDCGDDTSVVPHAFDATRHNVFEGNVFALASTYYSTSGGNGIQYAGQDGIIRRNVFYQTNVGLCMQVYSDEALYNHRNRVYHNTFTDNHCAGVSVREDNLDNVFKSNILFKNRGIAGGDCFGTGTAQIVFRGAVQGYIFQGNTILNTVPGENAIQVEFGSAGTLASFESGYPAVYLDNLELDPGFQDESARDYTLSSTSQMINAGVFLTRTTGAGSGTSLQVDDARYFHDGYGVPGAAGDRIQLEGASLTASVVNVDYTGNTLTLDRSLSWSAGQGVSLAFQGSAPDMGAYEYPPDLFSDGFELGDTSAWSVTVN